MIVQCHQPCSNEIKACNRKLSWPWYSKGDVLSVENTVNKKHIVINLLSTYHFCNVLNVVLELDFLCYCSTDEYPFIDRLISIDRSISPPFSFHGHYGRHPGRYMPETKCSAQRRQTFFVKARGSRRNFSNITFSSLLLCYCILHSAPNKTGSLRDRLIDVNHTRVQEGSSSHFLCLHGKLVVHSKWTTFSTQSFSRYSSSSSLSLIRCRFYFFKNLLCAFNSNSIQWKIRIFHCVTN